MTIPHTENWRFRPLQFLARHVALRTTQAAAARHLTDGMPQLATYAFDYIGIQINQDGMFERDELFVLFRFLAPMDQRFRRSAAIDIGANIGNHAVYFASRFATVDAFEPNPPTFRLLEINAGLYPNITAHNIGLGASRETRELHFSRRNFGDGSAETAGARAECAETATIEIDRLDALLPVGTEVSLLKIDVEGMEAEAMQGAESIISAHAPVIVFEQRAEDFEGATTPAIEFLRARDYLIFQIRKHHWGGNPMLRLANLVRQAVLGVEYQVLRFDDPSPGYYPMLVALPADVARELGVD